MYVTEVSLAGIRSFESASVQLARRVNVFVGANNSGKSTLLRAVLAIQHREQFPLATDSRLRYTTGSPKIKITLAELSAQFSALVPPLILIWNGSRFDASTPANGAVGANDPTFPSTAPHNAIYPYLSKRKSVGHSEQVREQESMTVKTDFEYLYAKLDYVTNSERPVFPRFMRACQDILGFRVSTAPSGSGKRGVYIIDDFAQIPIVSMGEGVINIVGLLVDLLLAENKIFLIEELENDIHPSALKKLLELIVEDDRGNQFLVSTHSNIVVRSLCANADSKLFNVSMELEDRLPTSYIDEIPFESGSRRRVLDQLGYDFADYDLHAAWLFLEESSAEQIIRDYLVPWFAPSLTGRLRTFAAGGISKVEMKFNDFDRLFVFVHLESAYKNRAWVIVDAGEAEIRVIDELRAKWTPKGWASDNFQQFREHDFERYFPARFTDEIKAACTEVDKKQKRELKAALLRRVVAWIADDTATAKVEFQDSARDVIERLQKIENAVA